MDTPSTPPSFAESPAAPNQKTGEIKHSGPGIASFILSVGVGVLLFGVFIVAAILHRHNPGARSPAQAIIGLSVLLLLTGDLAAVGLGIASLCQSNRQKVFGVIGLVLSGLTLLGTVALVGVGLALAHGLHAH